MVSYEENNDMIAYTQVTLPTDMNLSTNEELEYDDIPNKIVELEVKTNKEEIDDISETNHPYSNQQHQEIWLELC